MNRLSIEKFKLFLMEELVDNYHMTEMQAQSIIAKSTISKLLKTSPEFVMHYSIEDTAQEIFDEYKGITIEM